MTAHERWMRHLQDAIVETIAGIPAAERNDVYVVHLTLESEDDDNRRVVATVAWNTIQHLRAKQAHGAANPASACFAKRRSPLLLRGIPSCRLRLGTWPE